jgi:hypothetical protein
MGSKPQSDGRRHVGPVARCGRRSHCLGAGGLDGPARTQVAAGDRQRRVGPLPGVRLGALTISLFHRRLCPGGPIWTTPRRARRTSPYSAATSGWATTPPVRHQQRSTPADGKVPKSPLTVNTSFENTRVRRSAGRADQSPVSSVGRVAADGTPIRKIHQRVSVLRSVFTLSGADGRA